MEEPPDQPEPQKHPPDLGQSFWLVLIAPILIFGFALALLHSRDRNFQEGGIVLMQLSWVAALIAAFTCAIMLGNRRGFGLGLLAFFGFAFLYGAIAFAGCVSMFSRL